MLAERSLIAEPGDADDFDRVRGSLRELHGAMIASVQVGGGIPELAKLAHDACGVPLAVIVPGYGSAIEPATALGQSDRRTLESHVRRRLAGGAGTPEGLSWEVEILHNSRVAGIVGLLDDGVEQALGQLADPELGALGTQMAPPAQRTHWILDVTAAAVITALVIEDTRIDTEHRLRGSFLEQLRGGDTLTGAEIERRAARLGCDVSAGAVMLCVEVEGTRPRSVALGIGDEHPGAFVQPIEPAGGGLTQVWAILPALTGDDPAHSTLEAAKRLARRLRQYGAVGLSRFHADPAEFSLGLDEAELMLDVMRKAAVPPGGEIVDGTYKLLFRLLASHPDELSSYHASTIAPLVAHDDQYRTDLVRTLEVYLDTNCNMNVTADTIFAHRHTVAHRLERINELTGLDPTVHEDREQLGLGLKIHRLTA